MKLFGYTIHKTPLYDLAGINQFRANLTKEEAELKTMYANMVPGQKMPKFIEQKEVTVHVAREVYLRMLEKM